ncbi:coiled-coil domain-containing protein-domain-containing protein [Pilaira anomala]|nr:coiled-coil domain-containing protein-domain-containing protein [Pilaira anomala]
MDNSTELQVLDFIQGNLDNIPFKTLRLGEEELAPEEKIAQMQKTLREDPALFLSKWGRYLSQPILTLFQTIENNYEVDFYLDSLLYKEEEEESENTPTVRDKRPSKSALYTLAQNRRYEFLKRHLKNSDYFSDESIRLRDPILYDQFIGQHIPDAEKEEPFADDVTLVNRILSNIDKKFVDDHLHQQKIIDEEQLEEEEEEDDESDDEMHERSTPTVITKKKDENAEIKDTEDMNIDTADITDTESMDEESRNAFREEQRLELIRLLEEKFLAGKDDFDYGQVDYNEEYDDLEQLDRDIQDRYFDED